MITERVMQLGDWDLELRPDTPRAIREKVIGFSHLVVLPGHVPVADMTDAMLDFALFVGPVTRPGPHLKIGGHSLAFWMGSGDRYYTAAAFGTSLPAAVITAASAATLTVDINAKFSFVDVGLTIGTITDPTAGAQTVMETIAWISLREYLDARCKAFEVEWRVNPDGTVDVGPHTTLYGTPTVIVTPQPGGRDIGYRGIEALVDRQVDLFAYANRVYLMGRANYATAGSPAAVEPYRAFDGLPLWASVIVDGADMSLSDDAFGASRLLPTFNSPRQTVTVTSGDYDFTGDIVAGSRIYVWDPDSGLTNGGTSPMIDWRGEVIYPLTFRVISKQWPVREGMGVYIRRHTGSYGVGVGGDLSYVDLSDYVAWESGSTDYEIGYDINLNWQRV